MCDLNAIASVVVLYNPNLQVLENIHSYLDQVGRLLVIDNSDAINQKLIVELQDLENVVYISNHGNLGIAKALNQAAELALQDGCRYLLTMDQDSSVPQGMVSSLLKHYEQGQNGSVGIIAPHLLTKPSQRPARNKGCEECETVMTSGSLMDLRAYEKVGPFDESLFIDFVDIEYCLRLRASGYKVLRANDTCLQHHVGSLVNLKAFGKQVSITTHIPLRKYYKTRNRLFVWKQYGLIFPGFVWHDRLRFCLELLRLVIFEPSRLPKLRMVWRGICDYRMSRFGQYEG